MPHVEKHFTASETDRDILIGKPAGQIVPFALAAGLNMPIQRLAWGMSDKII